LAQPINFGFEFVNPFLLISELLVHRRSRQNVVAYGA